MVKKMMIRKWMCSYDEILKSWCYIHTDEAIKD